jgi:flavodoxin I
MDCAEKIYHAFGSQVAAEPVDIDSIDADTLVNLFKEHTALIVGTPTWNTGADTQRSGTGWDEIYYTKLPSMKEVLVDKTVAVFGLGDQSSYSSNFADATGELYDVFKESGCNMIDATWSTDGYEHDDSKSIRDGKFCGLILDMINQEDLTDERIQQWVEQLKSNGILDQNQSTISNTDDSSSTSTLEIINDGMAVPLSSATTTTASSADDMSTQDIEQRIIQLQGEITMLHLTLAKKKQLESGASSSPLDDYTPHYNSITRKTMWTSPDGRTSYFTSDLKP